MTPDWRIIADDSEVTAVVKRRFVSLTLADEPGFKGDSLDLVLDDRDFAIARPRKGVELRVWLGYRETGLYDMGLYVVDEVNATGPTRQLTLRARAANQTESGTLNALEGSLKEPKSRSWDSTTIGQIVATIAAEAGYTPRVSARLAAIQIAHIDQTAESDLHFLTRLGEQYGAIAKPVATNLIFADRATGLSASGQTLTPALLDYASGDLLEWDFVFPERGRFASVAGYWHDTETATRNEIVVGEGKPRKELSQTYPTEAEAQAAVWAEWARVQRVKATGSVAVVGNPLLGAERPVEIRGLRPECNGRWIVSRAEHTLDDTGYRTRFELEVSTEDAEEVEEVAE